MPRLGPVTAAEQWLGALLPFVEANLPRPPASVLEIGCGRLGGFVPALRRYGYHAVGVDPEAPRGPEYRRMEFERYTVPQAVDAVVASTSLHHVTDLDLVLDRLAKAVRTGGTVIVVAWAHERFNASTALWCFAHMVPKEPDGEPTWLWRHRQSWADSGQSWDNYRQAWAQKEGLHTGRAVVEGLDARFQRLSCAFGPYFFPDLVDVSEDDERTAIAAGVVQVNGIRYVGQA
jgi:SAM-dependent methyltransferase